MGMQTDARFQVAAKWSDQSNMISNMINWGVVAQWDLLSILIYENVLYKII